MLPEGGKNNTRAVVAEIMVTVTKSWTTGKAEPSALQTLMMPFRVPVRVRVTVRVIFSVMVTIAVTDKVRAKLIRDLVDSFP